MSKRPRIESRKEKAVEKKIQRDRKARNRSLKKSAGRARPGRSARPEPFIFSHGRGPVETSPKVAAWIEAESAEQLEHYRKIAREQERLAPQRKSWFAEFNERITGPRGFSVHAGTRRTIAKKEIPARPRRPWRVVW